MKSTIPIYIAWRRLKPSGQWQNLAEFVSKSDAEMYLTFHCMELELASGVALRDGEHPLMSKAKK